MLAYFIRRLLFLIPMMLVISFIIYLGLELTPGDAVSRMLPPDATINMKAEELEKIRESLGLNEPFIVRYFLWLGGVLQGDFGSAANNSARLLINTTLGIAGIFDPANSFGFENLFSVLLSFLFL